MHLNTSFMNYGRIICSKSIFLYSSIDLDFVCMLMSSYKIISQHCNWITGKAAQKLHYILFITLFFLCCPVRLPRVVVLRRLVGLWCCSWSGVVSPQFLQPYVHITAKPPEDTNPPGWLAGGCICYNLQTSVSLQNLSYWIIFPFTDFTA